jgi:signal transduction histidine kinase
MSATPSQNKLNRRVLWKFPQAARVRRLFYTWRAVPYSGAITLILATLLATLLIMALDRSVVALVNPGVVYLPVIAMIAYHWRWPLALIGSLLQLFCVYFFFLPPFDAFKWLNAQGAGQLIILAAVMGFVLAIVQLARNGRSNAERAAARFEALNAIGAALTSELDETRLLHLIAETACQLTGAGFAAFTLRPVNELGEPLVPSEGNLFYLAAVVGVTKEQEQLLRRMPLGGEGLLAPIFHYGRPVRVADALRHVQLSGSAHGTASATSEDRARARQAAHDYAHGQLSQANLRSMGVPRGHPVVRSFLGAPLLDRTGNVRGGLLLGHIEPDRFTDEDEQLLVGLAAQAAIALENARLFSTETRRALLQKVIDELPSSVYLVRGHDARLVLGNRATNEVWGANWQPDQPMVEFLAQNGIRIFHFDGRPLAQSDFATLRAVRKGETVRHYEEIIRHKDGTTLPVLVNAVALDSRVLRWNGKDDGEVEPAAIVVLQDVTALKEAERLKDEFIGIAAHELRTPLAVIKGFAQMLIIQTARGNGPELADWQAEAIQDIDQGTSRLVELTEDLLDVTRLQAGRLELNLEPTDLVALARRTIARFQVTTEKHTITLHSTREHIVVEADPRRIEQVVSNLLNNAIKYSPEGGEIATTIKEDEQAGTAILSVCDPGMGIPANQQSRIFGRFTRADNARDSNISGTGLGLYLSHELVERHNGRIWFESVEGQGSTFFVSLPLAQIVSAS